MFCCVLFFFCLLLYFVVFWEPRKWTRRKRNFRMTRSVISDMFVSLLSFFFYFDGYSHSFILFFSSFFFFFLPQLFRLALNGHDGTCHDLCTFGIFFFFSFSLSFLGSSLKTLFPYFSALEMFPLYYISHNGLGFSLIWSYFTGGLVSSNRETAKTSHQKHQRRNKKIKKKEHNPKKPKRGEN